VQECFVRAAVAGISVLVGCDAGGCYHYGEREGRFGYGGGEGAKFVDFSGAEVK
jgi:hypothetical protein